MIPGIKNINGNTDACHYVVCTAYTSHNGIMVLTDIPYVTLLACCQCYHTYTIYCWTLAVAIHKIGMASVTSSYTDIFYITYGAYAASLQASHCM